VWWWRDIIHLLRIISVVLEKPLLYREIEDEDEDEDEDGDKVCSSSTL